MPGSCGRSLVSFLRGCQMVFEVSSFLPAVCVFWSLRMLVDTWDDTPSSECVVIPCNFHFPRLILRTVQLQILYQINAFQTFSPSLWLSSHLLTCVQKSRYFLVLRESSLSYQLVSLWLVFLVMLSYLLSRQLLMPEISPSKCQLSISFDMKQR